MEVKAEGVASLYFGYLGIVPSAGKKGQGKEEQRSIKWGDNFGDFFLELICRLVLL
jgi:hypothetical protein